MASKATTDVPMKGGFSFDLCRRNEMLVNKGLRGPSFLKTGTTIVGLIFQVPIVVILFRLEMFLIYISISPFYLGLDWPT